MRADDRTDVHSKRGEERKEKQKVGIRKREKGNHRGGRDGGEMKWWQIPSSRKFCLYGRNSFCCHIKCSSICFSMVYFTVVVCFVMIKQLSACWNVRGVKCYRMSRPCGCWFSCNNVAGLLVLLIFEKFLKIFILTCFGTYVRYVFEVAKYSKCRDPLNFANGY